jgi:hypothetical protein
VPNFLRLYYGVRSTCSIFRDLKRYYRVLYGFILKDLWLIY